MGKPTPPAAPNPTQVAGSQTAADISTAVANSFIQNANETNPYGSVNYTQGGTHNIQVPTGQLDRNGAPIYASYDVPDFNRNVTLNGAQQGLLNQQNQLGSSLNNLAINQTNKVSDILSSPISTSGLTPNHQVPTTPGLNNITGDATSFGIGLGRVGATGGIQTNLNQGQAASNFGDAGGIQGGVSLSNAPTTYGASGPIQSALANSGNIQSGLANSGAIQSALANSGNIQNSIGPTDYASQRQTVEDAINSRLNPQLDRQNAALETKLVNQGLVRGTAAFNTAMDEANRQANDAHMQAILAGGQEQSRLAGLALQSGNFANAAQQQRYGQNLGAGQFANQSQQQQYDQNLGAGQFANAAQQQQYGQNLGAGQFANAAQQQGDTQQQQRGLFGLQATNQNNQNALNAGNFFNSAQQQNYNQQQGRGTFANAAMGQNNQAALNQFNANNAGQQQQYNQNMGVADFNNQANLSETGFNSQAMLQNQQNANNAIQTNNQTAQQGFANQIQTGTYQDTQRQQQLQEQLALRNQPLNEISALMSGGQVNLPQFQQYNPGTIANSQLSNDIYGSAAINQQNYQTQASQQNALLGALGGLGGAGLYGIGKKYG